MNGILNLHKPRGPSSAQYVYRLRPILGLRKIGHAGALDPLAEGVLVACIGQGTKLAERLMALPKCYRTVLRLGVTNECGDLEMPFRDVAGAAALDESLIRATATRFVGEIEQVPPSFSAVKVDGVASYHLARQGRPPPPRAKRVRVDRIDIAEYCWPRLTLEVSCGRGTYIRALARDLGQALGCGACCEALKRTAVGPFHLEAAFQLEGAAAEHVRAAVIPLGQAERLLAEYPSPVGWSASM
jgi:tRNA pseudouridine55 synthase